MNILKNPIFYLIAAVILGGGAVFLTAEGHPDAAKAAQAQSDQFVTEYQAAKAAAAVSATGVSETTAQ